MAFLFFFSSIILTGILFILLVVGAVYLFYDLRYRAWVETKKEAAKQMVELADLKGGERVYDLGCGDGRILIEAVKKADVVGIGYEINPVVVLIAWLKTLWSGCSQRVSIQRKDFFKEHVRDADVIFLYLFPEMLGKLEPKLRKELRPGTKIISNSYPLRNFDLVKTRPSNPKIFLYVA